MTLDHVLFRVNVDDRGSVKLAILQELSDCLGLDLYSPTFNVTFDALNGIVFLSG